MRNRRWMPRRASGRSEPSGTMKEVAMKGGDQPMRSTIPRFVFNGIALGTLAAMLALLAPGRAEATIINFRLGLVGVVFNAGQAIHVNSTRVGERDRDSGTRCDPRPLVGLAQ
jgi:hypothetical protein